MVSALFAQLVKRPMTVELALSLLFHVVQENSESHQLNAKHALHSPKLLQMANHALDAQPANSLMLTVTAQCAHHIMKLKIKELAYH